MANAALKGHSSTVHPSYGALIGTVHSSTRCIHPHAAFIGTVHPSYGALIGTVYSKGRRFARISPALVLHLLEFLFTHSWRLPASLPMSENSTSMQMPTPRTRVVPNAPRIYDRDTVNRILDEGTYLPRRFHCRWPAVCHPHNLWARRRCARFARSAASRMLRNLQQGVPVCVTVTLVDGLVLARSSSITR